MTDFYNIKATGKPIGEVKVTLKLDGVRVHIKNGVATSRTGKPLYNIPALEDGVYEAYIENFETTITRVRTHEGELLSTDNFYKLFPAIDPRLILSTNAEDIEHLFKKVTSEGGEGLVIYTPTSVYKMKKYNSMEVIIEGLQEGTNKYVGKLGAFLTSRGKVGTGFTDEQREKYFDTSLIGKPIEVGYMELTKDGKFRHPKFIKIRFDLI